MSHAAAGVQVYDGLAVTTRGDVVLALWKEPARLHRAKWLFDQVDAFAKDHPQGILAAYFILPSSSPPDGPARAENQRRLQSLTPRIRRFLLVPLGDAMWTAIVRTVLRGVAIVVGMKNHAIARDERDAFDQLLAYSSPRTPSRAELESASADLFEALGVAHPRAAATTWKLDRGSVSCGKPSSSSARGRRRASVPAVAAGGVLTCSRSASSLSGLRWRNPRGLRVVQRLLVHRRGHDDDGQLPPSDRAS